MKIGKNAKNDEKGIGTIGRKNVADFSSGRVCQKAEIYH
jgi:hypothetical protein